MNICPDDFDEDGIIDNIDLDHDNDGILNSIESKGTGTINFSDLENPSITLDASGASVNDVTISGTVDDSKVTDPLSGVTGMNGSFELQVEPGVNQELVYELDFSKKLNIKINSTTSSVKPSGSTFIIQTFPERSNITLIDLDDNLLLNLNGEDFESGPSKYTAGKIEFKFKDGSGTVPDTFEFLAFGLEGIKFTHIYDNVSTGESVFVPNVSVYDFINDTDGDSVEDIFQEDSDSDGCNDYIESNPNYDNTQSTFSGLFDISGDGTAYSLLEPISKNLVFPDDIDEYGRIINLIDASTGTYKDPPAHPDPSNENFLFQNDNSNSLIAIIQDVETGVQVCQDGESAQFSISIDPGGSTITPYYHWQR